MRGIVRHLRVAGLSPGRGMFRSAKALTIVSAAAVVLGGTLPAAGVGAAPAATDRPDLTIAMPTTWAAHGPVLMSNFAARVTYSLYDGLLRRDWLSGPGGSGIKIVPALATSWKQVSPTEWDFTIRKGVKFHNGQTMTVEDVVFSLNNTFIEGATELFPAAGTLKSVTALDDSTVRITTKNPDPAMLARMMTPMSNVVPKEYYLRVGRDGFGREPIGTGPYKWAERVPGESIKLEVFDDYWGHKPPLSSITFREVPEVSSRIAGLLTGEYDIVTSLPPDQTRPIDNDDATEIRAVAVENVQQLAFRMWKDTPIKDKRIRKAMALSIDRALLADRLWAGLTKAGTYDFAGYGAYSDAGRQALPFDPEGAKKLMKEAGYTDEPITVRVVGGYYTNMGRALEASLEMWKEVGLNVNLEVIENWGKMGTGGDLFATSDNMWMPDPAGGMWFTWGREGGHRMNEWGGTAPAAFTELGAILETSADFDERKKAYTDLLDMFDDLVPAILMYRPVEAYGVRKNLEWQPYTFFFMDFRDYNIGFAS